MHISWTHEDTCLCNPFLVLRLLKNDVLREGPCQMCIPVRWYIGGRKILATEFDVKNLSFK